MYKPVQKGFRGPIAGIGKSVKKGVPEAQTLTLSVPSEALFVV